MPRATLKHVAAKAGVSYQTVSKVLNRQASVKPETEARVWRAVEELDYRPNVAARSLRTQESHLIGCAWYPSTHNSWRPILNRFLYSVIEAAEEQGYLITFFGGASDDPDEMVAPYGDLYARNQVDGFVLAETVPDDHRIAYLLKRGIPFTSFGRANDEWDFCWVDIDGDYGIRSVVAHLLDRGHHCIGFLTWPPKFLTTIHREQGYLKGLKTAGISPDPAWIVRGPDSVQTGVEGVKHFLSLPVDRRPTAIACASDQLAVGAMNGAAAAGLQVGKDIAITGYDDVLMAKYLHPPLTTLAQPAEEAGRIAVELLLRQINGEPIGRKGILLKPELLVRKTS